jgi:hypothetical protein
MSLGGIPTYVTMAPIGGGIPDLRRVPMLMGDPRPLPPCKYQESTGRANQPGYGFGPGRVD